MAEVDFILDEATEIKQSPCCQKTASQNYLPSRPLQNLATSGRSALTVFIAAMRGTSAHALMKGTNAEFVFTDPPYNVPIDGHVSGLGRIRHREFAMGSGEMSQAEYTTFLEKVFRLLCAHTKNGSIMRSASIGGTSSKCW